MSHRLPMHQRMANALSYGEFRIFYQPVVDLQTDGIIGLEALCRWPQRDDSWAPPETFISQAESSGFIIQLGDWVLRTAVEQVRRWQQRFAVNLLLSVNLSGRQFLHYNLIKSIEDALRSVAYQPQSLEFEITESVAMHSAEDSIGIMRQLKGLGIGLSLDDFGTGYSSLAYLKRFPIDKIKIDRTFVRDIPDDTNDLAIVSAIIAMAHAMGLKVQAEGVETEGQKQFLTDCGCEYAQGFLFGRALPYDEFEELLAEQRDTAQSAS
ncbi:MAG: EAL domain-containing protein [Candidatus Eremiobacteraeota bacterium]|nr:EAL domain-containing protein [Candidatus Eremiobacteraeota bacterium]